MRLASARVAVGGSQTGQTIFRRQQLFLEHRRWFSCRDLMANRAARWCLVMDGECRLDGGRWNSATGARVLAP